MAPLNDQGRSRSRDPDKAPSPTTKRSSDRFDKKKLPSPAQYYRDVNVRLLRRAEWWHARCPFHQDKGEKPSLRVRIDSGRFRCETCGAQGLDVLDFHRRLTGKSFMDAVVELGALRGNSA